MPPRPPHLPSCPCRPRRLGLCRDDVHVYVHGYDVAHHAHRRAASEGEYLLGVGGPCERYSQGTGDDAGRLQDLCVGGEDGEGGGGGGV